jgi:hypothetical protein
MKKCKTCGCEIPAKRLEALPHTQTCVEHSNVSKFTANIVQVGSLEDDGFQEIEVVRDPQALEQLNYYRDQLGKYK